MTNFRGILLLTPILDANGKPVLTKDKRTTWRLASWFGWKDITVPSGATTDLASIPKLVWDFFPPDGQWTEAAVIHDYLYRTHGLYGQYTRAQADKVLRDAMADLGVPAWDRFCIYNAVRLGGSTGWGT